MGQPVYTQTKFKSLKSWLIWAVCASFSSLQSKELAEIKNREIAGWQKR